MENSESSTQNTVETQNARNKNSTKPTSALYAFREGEWVFWEFRLALIDKMEAGRIIQVSTGHIEASSSDFTDRCFPLEKKIKQISDSFDYYSSTLHREFRAINFPYIHQWFVKKWVEACRCRDDDETLKLRLEELREFYQKTREAVMAARVGGVNIFR